MAMSKYRHLGPSTVLLFILLMAFGGQVCAQPNPSQVSYSPDHWPTRWSSAIRQQKTARFPTRVAEKVTLEELPEAVMDEDLFFSPSLNSRFERGNRQSNYGQRNLKHRFSRDSSQYSRDSAYAYQRRSGPASNNYGGSSYNYGGSPYNYGGSPYNYGGSPYNYGGSPYMYPYANPMPAVNAPPMYPGVGFPMMPGVPAAYPMGLLPFGGTPYGYPGNIAMWNPPFGAW